MTDSEPIAGANQSGSNKDQRARLVVLPHLPKPKTIWNTPVWELLNQTKPDLSGETDSRPSSLTIPFSDDQELPLDGVWSQQFRAHAIINQTPEKVVDFLAGAFAEKLPDPLLRIDFDAKLGIPRGVDGQLIKAFGSGNLAMVVVRHAADLANDFQARWFLARLKSLGIVVVDVREDDYPVKQALASHFSENLDKSEASSADDPINPADNIITVRKLPPSFGGRAVLLGRRDYLGFLRYG